MLGEAERLVFASFKTPPAAVQQHMVAVGEGIRINTWTSFWNDTSLLLYVCMAGPVVCELCVLALDPWMTKHIIISSASQTGWGSTEAAVCRSHGHRLRMLKIFG